jgi:hypothetical protein
MLPPTCIGTEEATADEFGGEPSGWSSRWINDHGLIDLGSILVGDPLPWEVGVLPVSIREG